MIDLHRDSSPQARLQDKEMIAGKGGKIGGEEVEPKGFPAKVIQV